MTTPTATPSVLDLRALTSDDMARIVSGIPEDVQTLLHATPGLLLAGGCIRALVAGEPVSDFDLFGGPSLDLAEVSATLITARREAGYLVKSFATNNAITVLTLGRIPVQFITRWRSACAADTIRSFDFTVAQAAVWVEHGNWFSLCTPAFYPDLAARRLVYTAPVRDEDACGSLLRVRRFLAKGYTIQATSLAAAIARAVCGIPALRIAVDEATTAQLLQARILEVDPLRTTDSMDLQADHLANR